MMRRIALLFSAALAIASGGVHAAPPALSRVEGPTPVIVELFTSEGCIDCPPADRLLETLIATQPIAGAEIIALGEHVDYWDRLGWKDRFSSAALTSRQQSYRTRFAADSLYTPQMVVDGRAECVGSDAGAARKALERTLAAPHGVVTMTLEDRTGTSPALHMNLSVIATDLPRARRGDRADIIIAVTERGLITDVKRGENHGRVLTHAPVVRYLATVGQIAADATHGSARADVPLDAAWSRDQLALVAFVQELRGRTILASASVSLKNARP
jgi:hypothetical protein